MKAIIIILVFVCSIVKADEIHYVKVDIEVQKDRSLIVTEYYEFTPKYQINHGLYRHIPIKYYSGADQAYSTPLEILSVEIDGQSGDYHTDHMLFVNPFDYNSQLRHKNALWNKIIYMGSKDVMLAKNTVHTITLKYKINRIVKDLNNQEVIGWNVQGYDWEFTRNKFDLSIHLPSGIKSTEALFYLSYSGQNMDDIKSNSRQISSWDYDSTTNSYHLRLDEGLAPHQDITFFLHFDNGTFDEKAGFLEALYFNYKTSFLLGIGLILSVIIWFFIWRKHGIDPVVQKIRVLFGAPDNLSPIECRYFRFKAVDKRSTVAFIVDAAIKGYILIDKPEDSPHMRITKTAKFKEAPTVIKNGINTIVKDNLLIIKQTSKVSKRFSSLITKMEKLIKKRYPNQFTDNFQFFMLGSIPLLLSGIVCLFIGEHFYFINLVVGIVAYFLSYQFFDRILEGVKGFWTYAYIVAIAGLTFLCFETIPNYVFTELHLLLIALVAGIIAGLWRYLVKNQTALSRDKEMKIKAFEHYLKSTEERLMDFVNKPNEAPALFERNLPYAIALNCELKWVEAFEGSFDTANINYSMDWAHGALTYHFLSHSLVSTIETNSSYTPPSSSGSSYSGGGFSGGGFSGGGGGFGGGGGGGW